MKKKIIGIVSVSVLIAICVVVIIISQISTSSTEPVNQGLTSPNSTNYNLSSHNSVNYNLHGTNSTNYIVSDLNSVNSTQIKRWIQVNENVEGRTEIIYISIDDYLFNVDYTINEQKKITGRTISLNPAFTNFYDQVGYFGKPTDAVVIYPLFTQAAYDQNGFYDYYNKKCDSRCVTINIPTDIVPVYQTSRNAYAVLKLLNYDTVTDVDVDKNPNILEKYKKVIVLHNEYVTQKEFDAITHHPNVVYLYPNALYAKIQSDYNTNTITLVRGHGYPDSNTTNGFDWKFDNSKFEYNLKCDNWQFHVIDNGKMLDCYPSYRIYLDKDLLLAIS